MLYLAVQIDRGVNGLFDLFTLGFVLLKGVLGKFEARETGSAGNCQITLNLLCQLKVLGTKR